MRIKRAKPWILVYGPEEEAAAAAKTAADAKGGS